MEERQLSRPARIARVALSVIAAVVVAFLLVVGVAYWWITRPPALDGRYRAEIDAATSCDALDNLIAGYTLNADSDERASAACKAAQKQLVHRLCAVPTAPCY